MIKRGEKAMVEDADQELMESTKAVDSYLDNEKRKGMGKSSCETRNSKPQRTMKLLGGLMLLAFVALFAHLYRGGNKLFTEDLKGVRADLAHLERSLRILEEKIALLEKNGIDMQKSVLEAEHSQESLSANLTELTQEVGRFEKRMESLEEKKKTQPTKEHYQVQPGDTLYRISQKYGISVDKLRQLNGLGPAHIIHPGQKLIILKGGKE